MRIDNGHVAGTQTSPAGRAAEAQELERAGRERVGGAAADRVELSPLAHRIAGALEAAEIGQAARVRELARAYQAGRYQADPREISRRMIAEALQSPADPRQRE